MGLIIAVIIIVSILAVGFYSGWFDTRKNHITAKAAYDIAAGYALAGEPNARLYSIELPTGTLTRETYWVYPGDQGKFPKWNLEFCASDGANIELEVREKQLYVCEPWEGPANQKKSQDLWTEAHQSQLHPERYDYCISEWVDSTPVFKDAQNRMTERYQKEKLLVYSMNLHYEEWEILILTDYPGTGYKYYYHAVNGSYIKNEYYFTIYP